MKLHVRAETKPKARNAAISRYLTIQTAAWVSILERYRLSRSRWVSCIRYTQDVLSTSQPLRSSSAKRMNNVETATHICAWTHACMGTHRDKHTAITGEHFIIQNLWKLKRIWRWPQHQRNWQAQRPPSTLWLHLSQQTFYFLTYFHNCELSSTCRHKSLFEHRFSLSVFKLKKIKYNQFYTNSLCIMLF